MIAVQRADKRRCAKAKGRQRDDLTKDDFQDHQTLFMQPSVFVREVTIEKWPPHKVIASGDQLAAAYEGIRKSSFWREDPRLRDISRGTADEVLDLYNHVVEDGGHVEEFLTNPREVANKLGRRLSDDAVAVIGAAHQGFSSEVTSVRRRNRHHRRHRHRRRRD